MLSKFARNSSDIKFLAWWVILLPFRKGSLFTIENVSSQITATVTVFLLFYPKAVLWERARRAKAGPPPGCPIHAKPHLGSLWPNPRDKCSLPTLHSWIGHNHPSVFLSHRTNASEIPLSCMSTPATSNFTSQLHWKNLNPFQFKLLLFVFILR